MGRKGDLRMTNKKPNRQTEPAVDPAAKDEPANPIDQAVRDLLAALDIDKRALTGLEIRPNGSIRIILHDRSARTAKFTPLPRYERDRDGRIIE